MRNPVEHPCVAILSSFALLLSLGIRKDQLVDEYLLTLFFNQTA